MPEQKTDRRIVRTKRMIQDALAELMEEKAFERITVRDLTEKADINRGTFYLHYRDKYDLLEQSENEIIQEMEELFAEMQRSNIEGDLSYPLTFRESQEPYPLMIKLFEYLAENSRFMKIILGPQGDPAFQGKLKEMLRRNITQNIVIQAKEDTIVPIEYLIAYVSSTYLGIIQHWLENGAKESPRDVSLILARIMLLRPVHLIGFKQNSGD